MNPTHPDDCTIPQVTLASLPAVCKQLAEAVHAMGFEPEVIVYIERGARLIAVQLCRIFDCTAIAVSARRKGFGLRSAIAPLTARMPGSLRDTLRKLDERWLWQKPGGLPRAIESTFEGALSGRRILVVDDAVDSGRSIRGCLGWLNSRGATRSNIKVAVLAATTPAGREQADFWIFDRNTRLPWSSDSPERGKAELLWQQKPPPLYAAGDL